MSRVIVGLILLLSILIVLFNVEIINVMHQNFVKSYQSNKGVQQYCNYHPHAMLQENTNRFIPKIVHQTWKDTTLPANVQEWRNECIKINPEWTFRIWTDVDNRELVKVHYPTLLGVYDSYDVNIKRIDSARYMMLHRFGGLYMDMDFTCLQPFQDLFNKSNTFYVAEQESQKKNTDPLIANAWMAAPANHSFLMTLLAELPLTSKEFVLNATGPNFLTNMIKSYANFSLDPITILPMEDVYGQYYEDVHTDIGCLNTSQCRDLNPSGITVSFWTHTWH